MLESDRGYIYSDDHEIICVDRVQMRNNEYEMIGDSVVYNTETDFAQFFSRTNIWNKAEAGSDKEDDYLYADRGTFDKHKQLYTLTLNGYILTNDQELLCDTLDYYRDSDYVRLKRNIQIDDRSQKMIIFGDWGEYWKEPGNVFVTDNPSIISYDLSQGDSLFVRSDSMFVYTHYPIREKIEQARKDSLAQVAKQQAAADSLKSKSANVEETSTAEKEQGGKGAEKHNRPDKRKAKSAEQGNKATQQRESAVAETSTTASADSAPSMGTTATVQAQPADSTKVATDSTAISKPRELTRREIIDSLINDTINPRPKLLGKLLKEEATELNNIVKTYIKEQMRKRKEERAAMLAERHALYVKLLGEARVRDAERARIEREIEKRVSDSLKRAKDSLKRLAKIKPDSTQLDSLRRDSLKRDSLKRDTIKVDSVKLDSVKVDTIQRDSVKVDSVKVDSVKVDSTKVDSLAKFDTMTVKQVKAYFKAIYDKEKAEEERIKQDSLDAKLDRIGRARQAKRAEQYRKWAIRDSIYYAKAQERADEQLRRKLARMEKRGIFIQMADSSELRIVDSILLAEFGPLDSIVNHSLDSIIEILYPKDIPSPSAIAKADSLNIDSLYREIRAYRRVKMFRSDFQTVCDSLTMTTIDSIIRLYKLPVMWNGNNQITSDSMQIITRESKLVRAKFDGHPLTAAELDTAHYNQVTGKEMTALFRDNQIYRNDVNGNVQTIYYMQEDNSPEITLMAYIEAGDMTSYIEDQKIVGITYRGNPTYTFYPMDKIPETQPTKLQGFKWEANRRPSQDSVFNRTIIPSQRAEKRSLRKPLFPINALLQQRKSDYIRRREWQDRTDTLTYETIEWLESLKSF